eukprot:TRINITY_DN7643_c0_g1_i1.p2 TRINITY_DN7643_c0_g1~~TRINITY_DN7643_c0_g1_i1.p2  ORF type:complete len:105 (-),score=11.17 TRINITY_DN7643_c0_g1_i1:239-553(-)
MALTVECAPASWLDLLSENDTITALLFFIMGWLICKVGLPRLSGSAGHDRASEARLSPCTSLPLPLNPEARAASGAPCDRSGPLLLEAASACEAAFPGASAQCS